MTLLDPDKLGLGFEVYAAVKLSLPSRANLEAFEARLDGLARGGVLWLR
ncbi:MAG: hypothetical protein WDN06_08530 [Asticcacaulis sp.]